MEVKKNSVNSRKGSCNFCDRGKFNQVTKNLIYPYDVIYSFRSAGHLATAVNICDDCFNELCKKIKDIRSNTLVEKILSPLSESDIEKKKT